MRILQINSVCGYGSTGGSVVDLALALEKNGDECYVAYGQLTTGYPKSFKIGTKLENHLHNMGSRLLGKQGYFTKNGTKRLIKFIEDINPDLIHLHNLHGNYLNLKMLFDCLRNMDKPVIWTLHDCWAYTGKCAHYTDIDCYKWKVKCHNCPQLGKYPPSMVFDTSAKTYTEKKRLFTSIRNMRIITVSNWLAKEVEKSFLSKYPITTIYNWVDHSIFRQSEIDVKDKYAIDKKKFIILAVSASWNKNDSKYMDLLRLHKMLSSEMQIVVVGKNLDQKDLPSGIIHIPYVQNKKELAQIYAMSDVYVHLSTEDTFGKVIAEALSCGTPVIAYNSTVYPEIINEKCGYIVKKKDINLLYKKISDIKDEGKKKYSEHCSSYANEIFNMKTNIEKTIQLFKGMFIK